MKLLVGLGNPGIAYKKTRHNIGFLVIDEFCKKKALTITKKMRFKAQEATTSDLVALKPQTYMNLSGESVQKAMHFYKIALEDVLVIGDDVALPFGQLRLRAAGSSGGHNGLKSVEYYLKSQSWARLRVGVGAPASRQSLENFVLEPFSGPEIESLPSIVEKAVEATELWLNLGCSKAMNLVN